MSLFVVSFNATLARWLDGETCEEIVDNELSDPFMRAGRFAAVAMILGWCDEAERTARSHGGMGRAESQAFISNAARKVGA